MDGGKNSGLRSLSRAKRGISSAPRNDGVVFAIERIPELNEFGKKNIAKYNFIESGRVKCICADGTKGLPGEAPFDKIIAAAAAEEIPLTWKEQLKIGGRLVSPVKDSVWLLIKKSAQDFEEKEFYGFAFVPLIKERS
jgi:protein-L-isoaspartate(D-aspartate) O-methyltransferase